VCGAGQLAAGALQRARRVWRAGAAIPWAGFCWCCRSRCIYVIVLGAQFGCSIAFLWFCCHFEVQGLRLSQSACAAFFV
jgi:hypothetical protein